MEGISQHREKRKSPRVMMSLPILFQINKNQEVYTGLTIDASESGLLIQSFEDIPIGTSVNIKVLFPKGLEWTNFHGMAEVIWKGPYDWEDWEGYLYGLKFTLVLEKYHSILKQVLRDPLFLKEASSFDKPQHKTLLTVTGK